MHSFSHSYLPNKILCKRKRKLDQCCVHSLKTTEASLNKKGELCRDVGSVLPIVIIFPILSFPCLYNQAAQSSAHLGYVTIQDNSFTLMCLF